jgi:hypothetical protein
MAWLAQLKRQESPWYAEGLRFGCQACGRCCGGAPGFVWVDEEEIVEISASLRLAAADFRRLYVRRLWRGMSLREKANYDCVLLDGNGRCTAYDTRPLQCRTWPFWPSNLESPEAWDEASRRCPGMGSGPLYALEQIEALRLEMKV